MGIKCDHPIRQVGRQSPQVEPDLERPQIATLERDRLGGHHQLLRVEAQRLELRCERVQVFVDVEGPRPVGTPQGAGERPLEFHQRRLQ